MINPVVAVVGTVVGFVGVGVAVAAAVGIVDVVGIVAVGAVGVGTIAYGRRWKGGVHLHQVEVELVWRGRC